jgi:hypothetical protein
MTEEFAEPIDLLLPDENKRWRLRIHDKEFAVPGFDAVTLTLNATLRSTLDWKEPIEQAQRLIDQGFKIFWKLECGLFQRLVHPITNQSQFLSLTLALEHFREIIWSLFQAETVGVCFYQGKADFSHSLPWTSEQDQNYQLWLTDYQLSDHPLWRQLFSRDVCLDYLSLLAARLPETLPLFLLLDATGLHHSLRLLNPEKFERFHLILKGSSFPFEAYGWQTASAWGLFGCVFQELSALPEPLIGLCIPSQDYQTKPDENILEQAVIAIQQKGHSVRLIAENHLTTQWHGLNEIIYDPDNLSFQGKRKLQGFCAAGGTVISASKKNGFQQEFSLNEWLETI